MINRPTVVLPVISDSPRSTGADSATTLLPVVPEEPPVFVDATGRRRRHLRRIAYGVGLAGVVYTVVVAVSFAAGPVSPDTVVPHIDPEQQRPAAVPSTLTPTPKTGPANQVTEGVGRPPERPDGPEEDRSGEGGVR